MATYDTRLVGSGVDFVSRDGFGTFLIYFGVEPQPPGTGKTLDNPSFELASGDVEGEPSDWTIYRESYSIDWHRFGAPYGYAETFAYGYSSNEDSLAELGAGDVTFATFGSAGVAWEAYESEWLSNQLSIDAFEQTHLTEATFDAALDDVEDYESEWPNRHAVADYSREIAAGLAQSSNPPTVYALLNEIKLDFNLHGADDTVHDTADATNVITAADATDTPTSRTLADEIWLDVWAHILDTALDFHRADEATSLAQPSGVGIYPAADLDDAAAIANWTLFGVGLHWLWASNGGPGVISAFSDSPSPNLWALLLTDSAGAGVTDDYESGWQSNENSLASFSPGDLSFASFATSGGGTEPVETYEQAIPVAIVLGSGGEGTPTDIDPSTETAITISAFGGASIYQIQTLNPGAATWVTRHTVISSTPDPSTLDLGDGHAKVRIRTDNYGGGDTPSASVNWSELS